MTTPRDIYATVKLLLDRHGLKGAADHCLERGEELAAAGDKQGVYVWGQVRAALLDLSDIKFDGEVVN
ncbi:hypothetical protein RJ527_09050 [Thalassospiraceae bacterium LMO-SO8]|nr:hypothetical protein [Alphaproteobacteria bacterium LMO-S08]WND77878.1 hypothetical protein RJ527_09050 [Thalassospiraceae bacterium LMO-SO8]